MFSSNVGKIVATVLAAVVATVISTSAMAESKWDRHHPRRAEVNHRLNRQDRRIHREVREGEMTKGQAASLHKQDHGIRQEERQMASQNGGHITKQEQRTLNRQENEVSNEIGR
jgi:hypothetical protein